MNYVDNSLTAALGGLHVDVPAEKQLSKSQKKKAKRKQKGEQKGAAEPAFEIEEVTEGVASVSLSNAEPPKQLSSTPPPTKKQTSKQAKPSPAASKEDSIQAPCDAERETLKRVRALRKKLKQIAELERKIEEADINPVPEQLAKLATKNDLQRELEELTSTSS